MAEDKKQYLPLPPPDKTFPVKEELTESQQGTYKAVLEHFSKDGYKLPQVESGELLEQEKFWLVRLEWQVENILVLMDVFSPTNVS
jgi:hypothetical protein